jgi:riboflavin kinase / FMN adenylyltransferase
VSGARVPRETIVSADATPLVAVVSGVVEHGDHRGRTLDFPTANVRMGADHAAIADGVYAATVRFADGTTRLSAVSIGRRPTFYAEGDRLCEAHILDFDADIYGRRIDVELRVFLRRQVRFESLDELVGQLRTDVADCRQALGRGSQG